MKILRQEYRDFLQNLKDSIIFNHKERRERRDFFVFSAFFAVKTIGFARTLRKDRKN